MVTSPREVMISSAGARAGLTASMKAASFDVVAHGVTINNLLPERFATQRQIDNANRDVARRHITFEEAWEEQARSIAAGRHGRPEEFGATCAFVCSVHASFMSGMNIHLDGGSYPGLV
jgi:3-oxoacyl-[acyl-carrier protein] reductase